MQPRYFIGISLPKDLSDHITHLQHDLYDPAVMLRPLNPHITLLPPPVAGSIAPEFLLPKVREAAKLFLPFAVTLHGIGQFGKRVLYATVESPELLKLEQALRNLLPDKIKAQFYVGREFYPHVTLAQALPGKALPSGLIRPYTRQMDTLLPVQFIVGELTRYEWTGPRHYKVISL